MLSRQPYCQIIKTKTMNSALLYATEVFIAGLIACSTCFGHHYAHHQELKSIIQWSLPVVFRAVIMCEGYVSGLQDAAAIKTSVASSWHFISTYFGTDLVTEKLSVVTF